MSQSIEDTPREDADSGPQVSFFVVDRLERKGVAEIARRARGSWAIVGVRKLEPAGETSLEPHPSWNDFLRSSFSFVFVVSPKDGREMLAYLPSLAEEWRRWQPDLVVLSRYGAPPSVGNDKNSRARSFGCTRDWLDQLLGEIGNDRVSFGRLCFEACRLAFAEPKLSARVMARESPPVGLWRRIESRFKPSSLRFEPPAPGTPLPSARVIIPHLGDLGCLEKLLQALRESAPSSVKVSVGFDEEVGDAHHRLLDRFPEVAFFAVDPPGVGPYAIRHFLGCESKEDLLIFQDSDDLSCVDRIPRLLEVMATSDVDILGTYELRVDDRSRSVYKVRFTPDVNRSLTRTTKHPQLHPTTAVRRSAFEQLGGFSTTRKFASDREFLLRGFFSMKIRNLGEFLYVRRKRRGTLSTSLETGMESPARRKLRSRWNRDFKAIREGKLRLEDSSLAVSHLDQDVRFVDLRSEAVHRPRFG